MSIVWSETRLGNFYKFLAANCLTKVAKICWWPFGQFLITPLLCKSVWLLLGNFGGKLGNFLFHHLVTLIASSAGDCSDNQNGSKICLKQSSPILKIGPRSQIRGFNFWMLRDRPIPRCRQKCSSDFYWPNIFRNGFFILINFLSKMWS